MKRKRVVITGMGAVCGNAADAAEFAQALFAGKSGIKKCTAFDATGLSTDAFGEVDGLGENRFFELLEKSTAEMLVSAGVGAEEIASWGRGCRLFFGTLIFGADYFLRHSMAKSPVL